VLLFYFLPTACAVGCILTPLRGLSSEDTQVGVQNRDKNLGHTPLFYFLPTACAVGCILTPLRGLSSEDTQVGVQNRDANLGHTAVIHDGRLLSPLPGLDRCSPSYPRLAPWAVFLRRSAASLAVEGMNNSRMRRLDRLSCFPGLASQNRAANPGHPPGRIP